MTEKTHPLFVKVTGLPFFLQGWNNIYILEDEKAEYPTYVLAPYRLYCCFPIIGVKLTKYKGGWVLWRDCDFYHSGIRKLSESDDPFGEWSYGMTVTPYDP